MELELRDYIIVTMIVIILYLLYNKYNKEHFTTTASPEQVLKQKINDTFKVDLEPMRKLGDILTDLQNSSSNSDINLTTEYSINKLILNNLNVNERYITKDLTTNNNVIISHDTFNNYDIDIFPRGMIIAFYDKFIPDGWRLCDGRIYYINRNNDDVRNTDPQDNNYIKLITPNLVGRFIFGATDKAGDIGGADKVSLQFNEMPSHTHTGTKLIEHQMIKRECIDCDSVINQNYPIDKTVYKYNYISMDPGNEGNEALVWAKNRHLRKGEDNIQAETHENMPPYKRLLYIIKL